MKKNLIIDSFYACSVQKYQGKSRKNTDHHAKYVLFEWFKGQQVGFEIF